MEWCNSLNFRGESTFLVTGAAGFIGSNIVRELLAGGAKVRGVDDFSTGKHENVDALRGLDLIEGDINDPVVMGHACKSVDCIFHHAAMASVPKSVVDPINCNRTNVDGTLNVLMAAREAGVRRVIYAGSSAAYGDTPSMPSREDSIVNPTSPYAVSKLTGELYMQSFWKVYGLETVVLRYFNVFGPHQDPSSQYSGVLSRFVTQMLRGERPTIFGDGEQTRDFTFISSVVNANLLACSAPTELVSGGVFNIATGQRVSLNEVFLMLAKLTGFSGRPRYAEPRTADIRHSLADISSAVSTLGYRVNTGIEEGLRCTVDWYRGKATESQRERVRCPTR